MSQRMSVMLVLYCKPCAQLTHCGPMDSQPSRFFCPWNFPGKKSASGCHLLLQGILSTQRSNPCLLCLLHWQMGSLPLEPPGKPKQLYFENLIKFIFIITYVTEYLKTMLKKCSMIPKKNIISLIYYKALVIC